MENNLKRIPPASAVGVVKTLTIMKANTNIRFKDGSLKRVKEDLETILKSISINKFPFIEITEIVVYTSSGEFDGKTKYSEHKMHININYIMSVQSIS